MAYKKLLIDNPTCSRRFHLTFDDENKTEEKVEIACSICGVNIFSESNHPAVKLAREENLTQTTHLSDHLVSECRYEDVMSKRTQ